VVDLVQEEISGFKEKVLQNQPTQKKLPKSIIKNNLYIDYNTSAITSDDNHIISIRFSMQSLMGGMAHPAHYYRVLNYNLDSEQSIALPDLFDPDANYLAVLSDYTRQILSRRLANKEMIGEGTAPTPEHFQNWNIKPNGLLITFDEATVAPYVDGAQSVLVPYSVLGTVIALNSPIGGCIKHPKKCMRNNKLTGGFIDEAINLRHSVFNPMFG
jgi:hypothetical protein